MYCSICGTPGIPGLVYCKKCGARVGSSPNENRLSEASFNTLVAGVIAIPIAGIGVVIGLMSVMKNELGFSNEVVIAFALMSFAILLAAEGVLIWLLLSRSGKVKKTEENNQLKEAATQKLLEMPARSELNEPPPGIIEDTTRNLEPVPRRETKTF